MTLRGVLLQHEPLAPYTSWRVGGPAKQLFKPKDVRDLADFLQRLDPAEPLLWLGLGSNTLIRDGGFDGTVIVTLPSLNRLCLTETGHIQAYAGVSCARLARFAARNHLSGLEFLAGIPGTVGGALKMNAGCHNGETWDHVVSVEILDRTGRCYEQLPESFTIRYREIDGLAPEAWFLSATFAPPAGTREVALQVIRDLLARRALTQPTSDFSCGSVFRNPAHDYAGRLIEACGLKGYRCGGASISDKHANFILNRGSATARDIENTIQHAHQMVLEKFAIDLHREVQIIGSPA